MEILTGRIYRNKEFIAWAEKTFSDPSRRAAAIMAFNWLKDRYPQAAPIIQGELIDEFTETKRGKEK
jgi:hypothetical protein